MFLKSFALLLLLPLSIFSTSKALTSRPYFDDPRLLKAKELNSYMKSSADPCEDFYEFACGNFEEIIKPLQMNRLQMLRMEMDKLLMESLDKEEANDTQWDEEIKTFYESCKLAKDMDKEEWPSQLRKVIGEFGEMPVLSSKVGWNETNFNWLEVTAQIAHSLDIAIILRVHIKPDFLHNQQNAVILGQPDLILPSKSIYTDMQHIHEFIRRKMAKNLEKFLNISKDEATLAALEIFEFEKSLAMATMDDVTLLKPSEIYKRISMEQLQEEYGESWDSRTFFNLSMDLQPPHLWVQHEYLQNIFSLLQATPKHVLANYIFYSLMQNLPPRADCLSIAKEHFHKYLDNLIYRRHLSNENFQTIHLLWQSLRAAFENVLKSRRLLWMSSETRQLALQKLHAMKLKILTYEHMNFTQEYGQLKFLSNDYISNIKQILSQRAVMARKKIELPPQPEGLGSVASMAANYVENENAIQLPVLMLLPFHFWSSVYAQSHNFATLGSLLGHELLHGFDDKGRHYDALGQLHSWWDAQSMQEFDKRSRCFRQQYSQYIFQGQYLPDMPLQAENIADNGGIRLAHLAYLHWYATASLEQQNLEHLDNSLYSHEQWFFIVYAQMWCTAENPHFVARRLLSDSHVPARFRVLGPLANYEQFARAFGCARGSPMNPEKKCELY